MYVEFSNWGETVNMILPSDHGSKRNESVVVFQTSEADSVFGITVLSLFRTSDDSH